MGLSEKIIGDQLKERTTPEERKNVVIASKVGLSDPCPTVHWLIRAFTVVKTYLSCPRPFNDA